MLASFLCALKAIICLASKPDLSRIVTLSCRPDWMARVTLRKFCFSCTLPDHHVVVPNILMLSSEVETILLGLWDKDLFKGFWWLRYSLIMDNLDRAFQSSNLHQNFRHLPGGFLLIHLLLCTPVLSVEWKINLLELTSWVEILPSSATKVQYYFKKNFVLKLFWVIQTKGSAFVQFFKVFFAYRWLVFNFSQPLLLEVHTLRTKHFVCVA